MLVLSTKPLQKLTGTGRQTGGQANPCLGRLRLQKQDISENANSKLRSATHYGLSGFPVVVRQSCELHLVG